MSTLASAPAAATSLCAAAAGSSSDRITVFGYGSLMNEHSCRRTCKSTGNHRPGLLPGWQRVFSLVSMSQLRSGNSYSALLQLASVAVAPAFNREAPQDTAGALFDIARDEFEDLCTREHRYQVVQLECFEVLGDSMPAEDHDHHVVATNGSGGPDGDLTSGGGSAGQRHQQQLRQQPSQQQPQQKISAPDVPPARRGALVQAFVVVESTDAAYHAKCAAEDQAAGLPEGTTLHDRVGQFYPFHHGAPTCQLWGRQDILPVTRYLRFIQAAARALGSEDNLLDGTFLADRRTSIREVSVV
jgi:cation transport regulator ChaC